MLDEGKRKWALAHWLEKDLPHRFAQRLLPVDQLVAFAWGGLMAAAKNAGRGLSVMDSWIAATALAPELTLVMRNTKDFEGLGLPLLDPWQDADQGIGR